MSTPSCLGSDILATAFRYLDVKLGFAEDAARMRLGIPRASQQEVFESDEPSNDAACLSALLLMNVNVPPW